MNDKLKQISFTLKMLLILNMIFGASFSFAQAQTSGAQPVQPAQPSGAQPVQPAQPQAATPAPTQPAPPGASIDLGPDPGPVYVQQVRRWAEATNFAKNAADVAVGKLQLDMERDPKLKQIMSKDLIADLQQFFYELFISPETMTALAKVYAQYFSLDEMEELIAFYKSPLGQKMIKSNTELTLKTQKIGMMLLKNHERGYMEVIAKYLAKVQQ